MDQFRLELSADDETEELLQELLAELDDEEIDTLHIERGLEKSDGLAGEPVTIGAILTGSAIVISAVLRIVERRMEEKRQERALKIVAEGFERSPDLGRELAALAAKHADVSVQFGIAKPAWCGRAEAR